MSNINGYNHNIILGNNNDVKIEDPTTRILLYEREVSYLNKEITLKNKEIEARDRDIEMLKDLISEVKISRDMIKELYERKVNDLKRTIEILEGKKYS